MHSAAGLPAELKLSFLCDRRSIHYVQEQGSSPGFLEDDGGGGGRAVFDRRQRPKQTTKRVASNGSLVTLPVMTQPWVTPQTPDGVFAELVKVGTNGDSSIF